MNENKTKPSKQSVLEFLDTYPNQKVIPDCKQLITIFDDITKFEPVKWAHMIGFGTYHYKYASGREGDYFITAEFTDEHGFTYSTGGYGVTVNNKKEKLAVDIELQ